VNMERTDHQSGWYTALRLLAVCALLYLFLVGIKMMGTGCKAMASGEDSFARVLIRSADNPFVGLMVGIFVTSLIQSSSVTTSIVVALVASGLLPVKTAVPVVMGANIGTTVTNTIVSMGYVMRRDEFRRAVSGAVVHDVFNVLVTIVLLPLELAFGFLSRPAAWIAGKLPAIGDGVNVKAFNPLGPILEPPLALFRHIIGKPEGPCWVAGITALVGLVFIFVALVLLVKALRTLMLSRVEVAIGRALGESGWTGVIIGMLATALVQSSSITTSTLVPMAAAGIVTVAQILPITIGANIGTTVTALIASMAGSADGGVGGLTIALVHCLFNIGGLLIFYPVPALRRVPVRIAQTVGRLAARSRKLALVYVLLVFYGIPGALILVYRLF